MVTKRRSPKPQATPEQLVAALYDLEQHYEKSVQRIENACRTVANYHGLYYGDIVGALDEQAMKAHKKGVADVELEISSEEVEYIIKVTRGVQQELVNCKAVVAE